TVRVLVSAEFGAEIEPDDMAAFVAELARQGLLTAETQHGPVIRHETPLCAGSAVWLRFRAYDPDRLLDRLLPAVRFCFTPPFVAVAAAVIVSGVITVGLHGAEMAPDVQRLWSA